MKRKTDGDSIKCIGVFNNCHLYYDERNKQSFLLTPNFRITRRPSHYSERVGDWAEKKLKKYLEEIGE